METWHLAARSLNSRPETRPSGCKGARLNLLRSLVVQKKVSHHLWPSIFRPDRSCHAWGKETPTLLTRNIRSVAFQSDTDLWIHSPEKTHGFGFGLRVRSMDGVSKQDGGSTMAVIEARMELRPYAIVILVCAFRNSASIDKWLSLPVSLHAKIMR